VHSTRGRRLGLYSAAQCMLYSILCIIIQCARASVSDGRHDNAAPVTLFARSLFRLFKWISRRRNIPPNTHTNNMLCSCAHIYIIYSINDQLMSQRQRPTSPPPPTPTPKNCTHISVYYVYVWQLQR